MLRIAKAGTQAVNWQKVGSLGPDVRRDDEKRKFAGMTEGGINSGRYGLALAPEVVSTELSFPC